MRLEERQRVRTVEVFADPCCPFAHVGLRRFVARRAELGRDDVVLWVRAWPLELVNGDALDATGVAQKVAALRASVAPELFTGFDPERFPTTSLPALALAARAYRDGDIVGEGVSLALRTALFEEGRDVANPAELARIASACDIDLAETEDELAVLADWHDGASRGVVGSPHFFVDDQGFFCPSLDIEHTGEHFHVTAHPERLAVLLDRCLR